MLFRPFREQIRHLPKISTSQSKIRISLTTGHRALVTITLEDICQPALDLIRTKNHHFKISSVSSIWYEAILDNLRMKNDEVWNDKVDYYNVLRERRNSTKLMARSSTFCIDHRPMRHMLETRDRLISCLFQQQTYDWCQSDDYKWCSNDRITLMIFFILCNHNRQRNYRMATKSESSNRRQKLKLIAYMVKRIMLQRWVSTTMDTTILSTWR